MFNYFKNHHIILHFDSYFWGVIAVMLVIASIFIATISSYYIARYFVLRSVEKISSNNKAQWFKCFYKHKVFHRLIYLVPAFILHVSTPLFAGISFAWISILAKPIQVLTEVFILFIFAFALSGLLNSVEDRYNKTQFSRLRPIKSYLQVIKILIFIVTGLIIASVLLDKSLAYFLTGLSAMTAVLLLIFRDSILGFVASVQLSAHDIIRLGDWVEIPSFGADGTVLDISLNTIKIENFDKSIVIIPSTSFLSNSVKNWRSMNDAVARRIKRCLYIDVSTIRFCDKNLWDQIVSNIPVSVAFQLNSHTTNLGLLRLYVEHFLKQRKDIHQNMVITVHESEAMNNGKGLPLELYAFTPNTSWEHYERTQSEIFEHIYAILLYFDLKAVRD